MERPNVLLPTTLVGSYPQPDWLIDRKRLAEIVPPRARARELWRVDEALLDQAQDDATILAIRDQERAGIDVVTDGEVRRESYSNRFATALEGMDSDNPAEVPARTPGRVQIVPRVVGQVAANGSGPGARHRIPSRPDRSTDPRHDPRSFHDDAAALRRILQG